MKPVTEDQVQMLLTGLEQREKDALLSLDRDTKAAGAATGRMTSNAFRMRSRSFEVAPGNSSDVVDIDARRGERRRRITSKGFFFYSSEPQVSGGG